MKHYRRTTANHVHDMWACMTPSHHSVLIAMSFITALAIGFWLPESFWRWTPPIILVGIGVAITILTLGLLWRGHSKTGAVFKQLTVFTMGLAFVQISDLPKASTPKNLQVEEAGRIPITGFVKMAEDMRGARQRIRLVRLNTANQPFTEGLDYRLITARGEPLLRPGDVITAQARINAPLPMLLPNSFDFAANAARKGYVATGFVNKVKVIDQYPADLAPWLRHHIQARLKQHLPPESASVASAVLIGLRGGVTPAIREDFRASGLSHLLAISGLHMALFWGSVMAVMRMILACFPHFSSRYPSLKIAAILALPFGVFYLVISGMPVSAVRAFLMLALFMMAILLTRRGVTLHHVALAVMVILIIDPSQLTQPAFQMSFAAVFALVAGWMALSGRMKERPNLPRVVRYLGGIMLGSILAGGATMPFVLHHFGVTSIWSILANLAGMPLMAFIIMPFGALSLLAMPLGLEGPFLSLMGLGIDMLLWVAHAVAQLPLSHISVVPPPAIVLYVFTLAMVLCVMTRKLGRVMPILCLLIAGIIWAYSPRPIAAMTVLHHRSLAAVSDGSAVYYSRKSATSFEQSVIARPFGLTLRHYIGHAETQIKGIDMITHSSGMRVAIVWRLRPLKKACRYADLVLVMRDLSVDHCESAMVSLRDIKERGGVLVYAHQLADHQLGEQGMRLVFVDGSERHFTFD